MTKRVEIIDKREFAAAVLNVDDKIFEVHIAVLVVPTTMAIQLFGQAQVASLTCKKTRISAEYSNFSNIFSSHSAVELLEHTGINDHPINLLDNKQLPYDPIYCLELLELEILKTYIKANVASGFIRLSKFSTGTPILFV